MERGIATLMRQQHDPAREALRDLNRYLVHDRYERVPDYYPLSPSRRAANAVVRLDLAAAATRAP